MQASWGPAGRPLCRCGAGVCQVQVCARCRCAEELATNQIKAAGKLAAAPWAACSAGHAGWWGLCRWRVPLTCTQGMCARLCSSERWLVVASRTTRWKDAAGSRARLAARADRVLASVAPSICLQGTCQMACGGASALERAAVMKAMC